MTWFACSNLRIDMGIFWCIFKVRSWKLFMLVCCDKFYPFILVWVTLTSFSGYNSFSKLKVLVVSPYLFWLVHLFESVIWVFVFVSGTFEVVCCSWFVCVLLFLFCFFLGGGWGCGQLNIMIAQSCSLLLLLSFFWFCTFLLPV